jgi:hypothetical protein
MVWSHISLPLLPSAAATLVNITQFTYARNAKCGKLTVNTGSVNEVHILCSVYPYPVLTEGIKLVKFKGL